MRRDKTIDVVRRAGQRFSHVISNHRVYRGSSKSRISRFISLNSITRNSRGERSLRIPEEEAAVSPRTKNSRNEVTERRASRTRYKRLHPFVLHTLRFSFALRSSLESDEADGGRAREPIDITARESRETDGPRLPPLPHLEKETCLVYASAAGGLEGEGRRPVRGRKKYHKASKYIFLRGGYIAPRGGITEPKLTMRAATRVAYIKKRGREWRERARFNV